MSLLSSEKGREGETPKSKIKQISIPRVRSTSPRDDRVPLLLQFVSVRLLQRAMGNREMGGMDLGRLRDGAGGCQD